MDKNLLDSRKTELRLVSKSANGLNRIGSNKNSKTGVRNVSWSKRHNKYVVETFKEGKRSRHGAFSSLEEAAAVALNARERP